MAKARSGDLGAWDPSVPSEANAYNWDQKPQIQQASRKIDSSTPVIVDIFSGCGGISQGFKTAGFATALALDIHAPSVDTFRLNHPESATILGDVKRVSSGAILDALAGRSVTAACGGAPCQGFSLCNRKQFANDPRNQLFLQYMRIVRLIKPQFVMFENVQNIRSVADGQYARSIEEHFEDLGYIIVSGPVNAVDFGVPQKRVRWIVLGVRAGSVEISWPVGDRAGLRPLTVRDAIGDLPALGNNEAATDYDSMPISEYQRFMRRGSTRLLNHRAPKHPAATVRRIARTLPGQPMYASFKQRIRLSWDAPSPTQVSGGIRPQFQFGHPEQARGLTIRERCRMQSFPDAYEIRGGTVQGRVQTGNAVPPLVAEGIARLFMSLLTGQSRIQTIKRPKQIVLPLSA